MISSHLEPSSSMCHDIQIIHVTLIDRVQNPHSLYKITIYFLFARRIVHIKMILIYSPSGQFKTLNINTLLPLIVTSNPQQMVHKSIKSDCFKSDGTHKTSILNCIFHIVCKQSFWFTVVQSRFSKNIVQVLNRWFPTIHCKKPVILWIFYEKNQ